MCGHCVGRLPFVWVILLTTTFPISCSWKIQDLILSSYWKCNKNTLQRANMDSKHDGLEQEFPFNYWDLWCLSFRHPGIWRRGVKVTPSNTQLVVTHPRFRLVRCECWKDHSKTAIDGRKCKYFLGYLTRFFCWKMAFGLIDWVVPMPVANEGL